MTSIARRIVSGQKARFQDPVLDLDLDLTYVTDHLIIMGFPASGLQALYRNKRSSVKKFLDQRHQDLYRIYNMCPVTENSYDEREFYGRVSRFPFPDHHVPPLSLIPLFVADITEWLESDPDAVAVIHCKAGKGRSGTMTCCYLVSLPYLPTPPTTIKNYSGMKKPDIPPQQIQPSQAPARTATNISPPQSRNDDGSISQKDFANSSSSLLQIPTTAAGTSSDSGRASPSSTLRRKASLSPDQSIIHNDDMHPEFELDQISQRLEAIFNLHTQRRMKPTGSPSSSSISLKSKKSRSTLHPSSSGLRPSAQSTGGMPSRANSSLSLLTLGAKPAGRSCDALHLTDQQQSSTNLDPNASNYSFAEGRQTNGNHSVYNVNFPGNDAGDTTDDFDEEDDDESAFNQNTEDHSTSTKPKMGVSIPSQRRWVGYWTRILSGRDPRIQMTSLTRQPRRRIRITRIWIDRSSSHNNNNSSSGDGGSGGSKLKKQSWFERLVPHSDSLSVQLIRYDDGLVDRLESWERSARRRAKAFGNNDPSAPAKDLDAETQTQKEYLKTLRRKASDLKCWDGEKFDQKHADKIGNWGICTAGEVERARNFDWKDDQPQLQYFSLIAEKQGEQRKIVDAVGRLVVDGDSTRVGGNDSTRKTFSRYTFEPKGQDSKGNRKQGGGGTVSETPTTSSDSGYYSTTNGPYPPAQSSSLQSTATNTTPPSSDSYLPFVGQESSEGVVGEGQIVDADREICIKVLVGRTGSKHSKLPDVTSAGWCWFIPSFEDPITGHGSTLGGTDNVPRKGAKTVIRFTKDQIDFRKQPLGVHAISVEWEWVDVGPDANSI